MIRRARACGPLDLRVMLGGTAAPERDYVIPDLAGKSASDWMLTLPGGELSRQVAIQVIDDPVAEADETIELVLSPPGSPVDSADARTLSIVVPANDTTVTTTLDEGEGSLRQALLNANVSPEPATIRFDSTTGPFATPQTIVLSSPLPDIVADVTIDGYIPDRLWKPTGVTVSGAHMHPVFTVAPDATFTVRSFTIAHGRAQDGGGIANRGSLVAEGVTFLDNHAERDGGAIVNLRGDVFVANSTFVGNRAGNAGGGLADRAGSASVVNCTFSDNGAVEGGALFSDGALHVSNSILANSQAEHDCVTGGSLSPTSTHNLIETNQGCGEPVSTADPRLQALGGYNGPTPTMPLGGGSPAINLGDNASAVNVRGEPLRWDQRGNGDPRFVAGITDIGAFEVQAFPVLVVDTWNDEDRRACRGGPADCSLRGAIALANASDRFDTISFDPKVFSVPRTILPVRPLPAISADVTVDVAGTAGVTLQGEFAALHTIGDAAVTFQAVSVGLEE